MLSSPKLKQLRLNKNKEEIKKRRLCIQPQKWSKYPWKFLKVKLPI